MGKVVVALTSLPGAGKTEAANFFRSQGFPVVNFGDVILAGLDEKGMPHTETNERRFREEIRRKLGMAACAIKILPQIKTALKTHDIVVLDGMRSWEELLYLRKYLPKILTVAILCSPETRRKRLSRRAKRRLSLKMAQRRDISELKQLNTCLTILLADMFVLNQGTRAQFRQKLKKMIKDIHEEAKKD